MCFREWGSAAVDGCTHTTEVHAWVKLSSGMGCLWLYSWRAADVGCMFCTSGSKKASWGRMVEGFIADPLGRTALTFENGRESAAREGEVLPRWEAMDLEGTTWARSSCVANRYLGSCLESIDSRTTKRAGTLGQGDSHTTNGRLKKCTSCSLVCVSENGRGLDSLTGTRQSAVSGMATTNSSQYTLKPSLFGWSIRNIGPVELQSHS